MKIKIIFFFSLTASLVSLAQNKNKDSALIIEFKSNLPENVTTKNKKRDKKNIIKITPLGTISGIFPVLLERKLNDFLSIQAGAGVTMRNYFRSATEDVSENWTVNYPWGNDPNYFDHADAPLVFDNRRAAPGYCFSIQPRWYFRDDAPEDEYIGVSLDYGKYNFKYNFNNSSFKEYETLLDYMTYFGQQKIFGKMTLDYALGLGIRFVKGEKFYSSPEYTPAPTGMAKYSQQLFNKTLQLRIGYRF